VPDFLEERNVKNKVKLNGYLLDCGDFFDKNLTKMDDDCQNVDYKPSQNKDFGSRSPAKTRRDKKAEPSFSPPRLLTGSSTRILKYVEDLKRGSNAEVVPKDYFEIASIMGSVNKPYAMRREI